MEGVCPADARPRRSECSHVAFHDDSREADAWNLETPDRDVRFTRWGDSIPAAIDREVVAGSTESSQPSVLLDLVGEGVHRDRAYPHQADEPQRDERTFNPAEDSIRSRPVHGVNSLSTARRRDSHHGLGRPAIVEWGL
jgi:hypothetical protein